MVFLGHAMQVLHLIIIFAYAFCFVFNVAWLEVTIYFGVLLSLTRFGDCVIMIISNYFFTLAGHETYSSLFHWIKNITGNGAVAMLIIIFILFLPKLIKAFLQTINLKP